MITITNQCILHFCKLRTLYRRFRWPILIQTIVTDITQWYFGFSVLRQCLINRSFIIFVFFNVYSRYFQCISTESNYLIRKFRMPTWEQIINQCSQLSKLKPTTFGKYPISQILILSLASSYFSVRHYAIFSIFNNL